VEDDGPDAVDGTFSDRLTRRQLLSESTHGLARLAGQLIGLERLQRRLQTQLLLLRLPEPSEKSLLAVMGSELARRDHRLYWAASNQMVRRIADRYRPDGPEPVSEITQPDRAAAAGPAGTSAPGRPPPPSPTRT